MHSISSRLRNCGWAARIVGILALLGGARAASAQTTAPSCSDATMFPNPIYLTGSSAFRPAAGKFAVKLATLDPKYTIIYVATASCDGPTKIRDQGTLTGNGNYFTVDPADATKVKTNTCVVDASGAGTQADVGVADVSYNSCFSDVAPATLGEYLGPVQAMQFVVPEANVAVTAISAEQAAAIWGCGAGGAVSPFIDETAIMARTSDSGTQIMVSKYIGVPANAFKGVSNTSGDNLVNALLGVSDAQKAIGFYASDGYDTKRSTLNALAFRGVGQTKAYYADSTAAATDKRNVRDGHYQIFGPLHLFAPITAGGAPTGNAKKLIDWVQGNVPIEDGKPLGYIDIEAGAGLVPLCAMHVIRDDDGGFLKPYKPDTSCSCYYEKVVTMSSPVGCVPCTDDSTCPSGKTCQSQYCE